MRNQLTTVKNSSNIRACLGFYGEVGAMKSRLFAIAALRLQLTIWLSTLDSINQCAQHGIAI